MPEYRPLPEAREREFAETVSYAFSPESGPHDHDPEEGKPAPARPGARRGLFEDGELLAICKHHWFTCQVGEDWLPVGGVSAVATPPEHRRQGHVGRILSATLSEYREREVPLAALWAFKHAFYAQFGWALANRYARITVPPRELAFARGGDDAVEDGTGEGSFVPVDPDDYERLVPVLSAHGADDNLAMDRTEEWWRTRVFSAWDTDPYVYGWERDGEMRAYVVYTVEDEEGRTLHATETAWVDHEARLAALGFLANHDSQVESIRLYASDAGLLDVVPDPGEVDVETNAGPMVRLVDVRRTLRDRSYPEGASGSVVLEVDDPLADWNDARFRLGLEGGDATVDRIDGDAPEPSGRPDVRLDVGALSQLCVGYRSIGDLARTGDADVSGEGPRDVLADAFPTADVFLREGF